MRRVAAYGAAGLVLALVIVGIAATALPPAGTRAVALSAAIAYGVQMPAFGALYRVQSRPQLFLVVWLGGMAVRFLVLGVLAFWAARGGGPAVAPLLLGYVGVVFALVLLEPLFLRRKRPE
jgi:hypothetical protein